MSPSLTFHFMAMLSAITPSLPWILPAPSRLSTALSAAFSRFAASRPIASGRNSYPRGPGFPRNPAERFAPCHRVSIVFPS
jgi:hypothetical protein